MYANIKSAYKLNSCLNHMQWEGVPQVNLTCI